MTKVLVKKKITETVVIQAQAAEARYSIADTEVSGFWLTVTPTGRKSFYYRYRVGGGRSGTIREPKIGEWPATKAEAARKIVLDWAAQVRMGGDPSGDRQQYRKAPTMDDLFDRYLSDHARQYKKASSVAEDEDLIKNYLRPSFGQRKVAEVTRDSVDKWHKALADKPYRANRALALLSKAFNLAELWEMRPDNTNPIKHLKKFTEKRRQRYLSPAELARLGEALREAERDGYATLPAREGIRDKEARASVPPSAVAAVRLLILTGARLSEILTLEWKSVDKATGRARLPDSKTGEKTITLPPAALAVLRKIKLADQNPFVLPGANKGRPLINLQKPWRALREVAGLDDVRIHDLRHSFASVGADGGASLPIIGALLGHAQPSTTARYAHLSDSPLQAAAAQIGYRIALGMGDSPRDPEGGVEG